MIHVTCFSSATETKPLHVETTWAELVDFLASYQTCDHQRRDKKCHAAMTLAHIVGRRSNENVVVVSGIAADIDIGPDDERYLTFAQMNDLLGERGWAYIIYTTTKSSVSHNRYRIVLVFEHDISPDRHRAAWAAVNLKLGGVIDVGTKDPARLSFLPANWVGDYIDDRTGQVTPFDDGFNAFAWGNGNPILTADELCNLTSYYSPTRDVKTSSQRAAQKVVCATACPVPRPAAVVPAHVSILADWRRSPYIKDWMRAIADEPGQRDFRFLCSVARYALRIGLWIDVELLTALGPTFSISALGRSPPDDLIRQAENALEFAKAEPR